MICRKAGVMSDGDGRAGIARLVRRPDAVCLGDRKNGFIRQCDGIVFDACDRSAANVGTVP